MSFGGRKLRPCSTRTREKLLPHESEGQRGDGPTPPMCLIDTMPITNNSKRFANTYSLTIFPQFGSYFDRIFANCDAR